MSVEADEYRFTGTALRATLRDIVNLTDAALAFARWSHEGVAHAARAYLTAEEEAYGPLPDGVRERVLRAYSMGALRGVAEAALIHQTREEA